MAAKAQKQQEQNNTNKWLIGLGLGGGAFLALLRAFRGNKPQSDTNTTTVNPSTDPVFTTPVVTAPVAEKPQATTQSMPKLAVSKYSTVLYKEHTTYLGIDVFKKELIRIPSGTMLGLVREYTDDMVLISYTIDFGGKETTYNFYAKREHVTFVLRRTNESYWGNARLKEFISKWINI